MIIISKVGLWAWHILTHVKQEMKVAWTQVVTVEQREEEGLEMFWGNIDRTWAWVGCGVLVKEGSVKESRNLGLGRIQWTRSRCGLRKGEIQRVTWVGGFSL